MIKDSQKKVTPVKVKIKEQDRLWAMICHLCPLTALVLHIPGLNIVLPLIIWAVKKKDHPALDREGKEVMNFQISILIYWMGAFLLAFVYIGVILMPLIILYWILFIVIASVTVNNGESYTYPFTIRIIK